MYNVVNNKNDKNSLIINIIILFIVIFILLRNLFFIVDDMQFAIIVDGLNNIVRTIEKIGEIYLRQAFCFLRKELLI